MAEEKPGRTVRFNVIRYMPVSTDIDVYELYDFIDNCSSLNPNNAPTRDFLLTAGLCILSGYRFCETAGYSKNQDAPCLTEETSEPDARELLQLAWSYNSEVALLGLGVLEYRETGSLTHLVTALSYGFGEAGLIMAMEHAGLGNITESERRAPPRITDAISLFRYIATRPQEPDLHVRAWSGLISCYMIQRDWSGTAGAIEEAAKAGAPPTVIDDFRIAMALAMTVPGNGMPTTPQNTMHPNPITILEEYSNTIPETAYRLAVLSHNNPARLAEYFGRAIRAGYRQNPDGPVETRIRNAPNTFAEFISRNTTILHPSILRPYNKNLRTFLNLRKHFGRIVSQASPDDSSNPECCVCMEPDHFAAMNCGHPVCHGCYGALLKKQNPTCPMCRGAI